MPPRPRPHPPMPYDPHPHYPIAGTGVEVGHAPLAREVAAARPSVLAVDGPPWLAWEPFVAGLERALHDAGISAGFVDTRTLLPGYDEIVRRTSGDDPLASDPGFARVPTARLADLVDGRPSVVPGADMTVVHGPGSALGAHDLLWCADVPKRHGLAAARDRTGVNLGADMDTPGSERRMLFVDWPLMDRHKHDWAARWDRVLDARDPDRPRSVEGPALRATLEHLARGPFRTKPTFEPGPWGGQWMRRVLGVPTDGPNLAWSYELIAPESGIVLGEDETVEVGFEVLLAVAADAVMGREVVERFGPAFPVRFDYLDTMDGGNLSLHCHPRWGYADEVFGLPYPQDESYYVMASEPGARIFLGLRDDADLDAFRAATARSEEDGTPLAVEQHAQWVAARRHQLYLIPAGTLHASGEGNVVLEISSTPYLYSLRVYDWLRRDLRGRLRPIHLDHAFANLDRTRRGPAAAERLVPEPTPVRSGDGFVELRLGALPELFFAVHRLEFDDGASDDTAGRFHVLNLVEGEAVELETAGGRTHALSYAETIVVPAAVGPYRLRRRGSGPCKVVKALVVDGGPA